MILDESTDPKTSHRLLVSNCVVAGVRKRPMGLELPVYHSLRSGLSGRVLTHSCPGLPESQDPLHSVPRGRVRWAREVIGPGGQWGRERIKPYRTVMNKSLGLRAIYHRHTTGFRKPWCTLHVHACTDQGCC